jgi:hypothetical protein
VKVRVKRENKGKRRGKKLERERSQKKADKERE